MPDILIIGGGVTGAAAACALARAGHAVTLLEQRHLAAMGSGWSMAGVRQSGRHPAELPLALEAIRLWGGLAEDLGADLEYRRLGNLRVARDETEVAAIRDLVANQQAAGLDIAFLPDNAAVRAIAPALPERIVAASYCPTDGQADPLKAVRAFAEAARRAGADIQEGVGVRAIRVESGRATGVETDAGFVPAGHVVVAAGIHTPELIGPLGLDLPIETALVSVLQSTPMPRLLDQVFGTAGADCAGRQEADGRLRVTNSRAEWRGDAASWTPESIQPTVHDLHVIIHRVGAILPALHEARIARVWGGLLDVTPDSLPVIDNPIAVSGLTIAAGFSGHGFALGPITGRLIADLVVANRPRLDLTAFRLARFAGQSAPAARLSLHG